MEPLWNPLKSWLYHGKSPGDQQSHKKSASFEGTSTFKWSMFDSYISLLEGTTLNYTWNYWNSSSMGFSVSPLVLFLWLNMGISLNLWLKSHMNWHNWWVSCRSLLLQSQVLRVKSPMIPMFDAGEIPMFKLPIIFHDAILQEPWPV